LSTKIVEARLLGSFGTLQGMAETQAQFDVGQLVHHQRFGYRGVIVDVDPVFSLSEKWYEQVARSRPPKDHPWYHVLVDEGEHMTYVAERNLEADEEGRPIRHPLLSHLFAGFHEGHYTRNVAVN